MLESKLVSVPGLIVALFSHMAETRKNGRKSRSGSHRVTFSNVEEVQFAVQSANSDSIGGFNEDGVHSDGSYRY